MIDKLVTVSEYTEAGEADRAKSQLEAEGIAATLTREAEGTAPDGRPGKISLQVSEADGARAQEILTAPADQAEGSPFRRRPLLWSLALGIFIGTVAWAMVQHFQTLRRDQEKARVMDRQGMEHYQNEAYEAAIADFTEAVDLDPQAGQAFGHRGLAYLAQGHFEKAIADLNKAIRLGPPVFDEYYGRGLAHYSTGHFDQAIEDFTQAISLNPQHLASYSYRGLAYGEKKETRKGIADFTKVLQLRQADASAHTNRANLYRSLGEYEKAIADYNEALRLDPNSFYPYQGLAWLWATCPQAEVRSGQKALETARMSCDLTGWKNPFCLAALAAACAELGQFAEAVHWQEQALKFPEAYGKEGVEAAHKQLAFYGQAKPFRDE